MTSKLSKTALITAVTNAKLLATIEQTAAQAAVVALTTNTEPSERYRANRRLAIAKQRLAQETEALVQANQLP